MPRLDCSAPGAIRGCSESPFLGISAYSVIPGLSQGPENKKYGLSCNFFAIRDCRRAPRCKPRSEIAANQPRNGPFLLLRMREGVPNRKKVARKPRFLFSERGATWPCDKEANYLGGVKDISFHVKQNAASGSGISEWVGTLVEDFGCQGYPRLPTSLKEASFMEGV